MDSKPVSLNTNRVAGESDNSQELTNLTPDSQTNAEPAEELDLSPDETESLKKQIIEVLHSCFDPEIPVNIYELGLIYDIQVKSTGGVDVKMTLTSPACPVAGSLPQEVQYKIRTVPNVTSAKVDLVWDPPWTKDRMSEAAKLQLGIDD